MTKVPSHRDLCLSVPLYAPIELTDEDAAHIRMMVRGDVQFDAHCVECGQSSTFKDTRPRGGGAGSRQSLQDEALKDGFFSVALHCTRRNHYVLFEFHIKEKVLRKYGQLPSMEDMAGSDLEKYRGLLGKDNFAELRRASGLASHGIGIGSFVYLRRIFERLVYQHHKEWTDAGNVIDDFERMRMDDKIGALSASLPPALVRNKKTYAILSKGIHELDEDTCRIYFPVVKAAIMQILEQDFQQRETKKKEVELEREIASIDAKLKAGK